MGALKPDAEHDTKNQNDVVLKLDMHCSGCVKKLKKFLHTINGVSKVKVEFDLNKLTVSGQVDPLKLRDLLANKTNKKIDIISPLPSQNPPPPSAVDKPKAAEEEAPKSKPEVVQSTVAVLKAKLHCEGCIKKIRKIVARFEGVQDVDIDGAKDLIKVTGTMDLADLIPYLVEKLQRNVEIVPSVKKEVATDDKKKVAAADEEKAGGDNVKKDVKVAEEKKKKKKEVEVEVEDGDEVVKVEAQRMMHQRHYESHNYNYGEAAGPSNLNWYGGGGYGGHHHRENRMWGEGSSGGGRDEGNVGYVVEHYQYENHHHAPPEPGMFSDENLNGCSVM